VLEAVEFENAPAGETFTTYNFEVADYHTYFAGAEGIWVHNTGLDPCELISALTRTKINNGVSRRQAILEAMMEVKPNGGAAEGIHKVTHRLRGASDFMMDELPDLPTPQQMADVFTYSDYKALMNSKGIRITDDGADWIVQPGAQGQRGHHTVTRRIQQELQGRFGINIPDIDNSPVKVLTHDEHYGTGNSFHNLMNSWNNGALTAAKIANPMIYPPGNPGKLIDELILFYQSQPSNPDWVRMVKTTRGWANQKGIPISE